MLKAKNWWGFSELKLGTGVFLLAPKGWAVLSLNKWSSFFFREAIGFVCSSKTQDNLEKNLIIQVFLVGLVHCEEVLLNICIPLPEYLLFRIYLQLCCDSL
jgi:hypothetical protein